jgi:phage terminase large subunit-like protein
LAVLDTDDAAAAAGRLAVLVVSGGRGGGKTRAGAEAVRSWTESGACARELTGVFDVENGLTLSR